MKTPEIILIILWSIPLLYSAYLHGKEKTVKQYVFSTIIALAIVFLLCMWAVMFKITYHKQKPKKPIQEYRIDGSEAYDMFEPVPEQLLIPKK